MPESQSWLEFPSGERVFISGICTIGRIPGNQVVVPSERVSRRHAVIRRVPDGAFELMDMGSSNGTYLNGQRLSRPARLTDGAIIEVGLQKMTFRLPPRVGEGTIEAEVIQEPCWLLVVEAAMLGTRSPSEDSIGKTIEGWSERCQRVIQKYRGLLLRAANEGFLACWRTTSGDDSAGVVSAVLHSLQAVQSQTEEFRFALHYGEVTLRRGASGEWKPTGNEVIFTLQLERLVRAIDSSVLITEPAQQQLSATVPMRALTPQEMRSYRGSQRFFTLLEHGKT